MSSPERSDGHEKKFQTHAQTTDHFSQLETLGQLVLGGSGFRICIDDTIPTMAFDCKRNAILINPKFTSQLTDGEEEYVFCHEIGHIIQLLQDSDAYLGIFDTIKDKAKDHPSHGQGRIEDAWRMYFNCFLDIHDNSIHEFYVPAFWNVEENPNHPRKTLYKRLFSADLADSPLHVQLCHAALRRAMLPNDEIRINDEVANILKSPLSFLGQQYQSLEAFIKTHIFSRRQSISDMLFYLEHVIQPHFEHLLKKDIDNNAMQISKIFMDLDACSKDAERAMREVVNEIKNARKSTGQRTGEMIREQSRKNMDDAGLTQKEIRIMEDIMKTSDSVFLDLEELWRVFLQISTMEIRVKEDGFRTGTGISQKEFVRQISTLLSDPSRQRIFTRTTDIDHVETIKPKKIHLFLALDLSESMDRQKRRATQEAAYASAMSLIMFWRNALTASTENTEHPVIDINLNIIGYGDKTKSLFEHTPDELARLAISNNDQKYLDERLWSAILRIGNTYLGGTDSSQALQQIYDDLEGIADIDVFARGIKIPGSLYDDSHSPNPDDIPEYPVIPEEKPDAGTFERVWGKCGKQLQHISKLKDLMKDILFNALINHNNASTNEVAVVIEITDGDTVNSERSKYLANKLNAIRSSL